MISQQAKGAGLCRPAAPTEAAIAAQGAGLTELENLFARPLAAAIAVLRQVQNGQPVDPKIAQEVADAGIAALDHAGTAPSTLWAGVLS